MRLLASLNHNSPPPIFVTLTYPSDYSSDFRVWKRHLDNFCRRLLRKWPQAAIIWRLEFQERGAPHFHLLVFGVDYIPFNWVARAWYEVVGSGDDKHLRAGTRVEKIRSWRAAFAYASKYLAKEDVTEQRTGRIWGVYGRANLPLSLKVTIQLDSLGDFFRLRRVLARVAGISLKGFAWWWGLTVFLSFSALLRLISWLGGGYG